MSYRVTTRNETIIDMNVCPLSEKDKSYPRFFMECNRITNTTLHKQYGIT